MCEKGSDSGTNSRQIGTKICIQIQCIWIHFTVFKAYCHKIWSVLTGAEDPNPVDASFCRNVELAG